MNLKQTDSIIFNFFNRIFSKPIAAYFLGYIIGFLIACLIIGTDKKPKTILKPCKHITERDAIFRYEKYLMFLDELELTKDKKKIERLTDSLIKYRAKN